MVRNTTIYLTNKELLSEIHKSKMTYVHLDNPCYYYYDTIVYDLNVFLDDDVCTEHYGEWEVEYTLAADPKLKEETSESVPTSKNPEVVKDVITNLFAFNRHKEAAKRTMISTVLITPVTTENFIQTIKQNKAKKLNKGGANPKVTTEDILTSDLVIRLMTYDHIPDDEKWDSAKTKKKASDGHIKLNFPPFQMFVLENGTPRCVGLSHYKGDKFTLDHGRTSEVLGEMYIRLVEKISKKGSFRNYTYIDEMKASARLQLAQVGLLFDEGRSANPNPFAFYTTVVTNVFKRVLNSEKRVRDTRDDLIEIAGQNPSSTRQSDDAWLIMSEEHGGSTSDTNIHKNRKNRN